MPLMPGVITEASKRESKKETIRASLIEAARQLFSEKPYRQVTLEEIADKASFHVQTLYRHFKNKVNLALAIDIFGHEGIVQLLMDPDRTESIQVVWRRDRLAYFSTITHSSQKKEYLQLGDMINSVPALKAQSLAQWKKTETLLAVNIAKDAGTDVGSHMPSRLLAAMLVSGHLEVMRRWAASKGTLNARRLYEETIDYIDRLFALRQHVEWRRDS